MKTNSCIALLLLFISWVAFADDYDKLGPVGSVIHAWNSITMRVPGTTKRDDSQPGSPWIVQPGHCMLTTAYPGKYGVLVLISPDTAIPDNNYRMKYPVPQALVKADTPVNFRLDGWVTSFGYTKDSFLKIQNVGCNYEIDKQDCTPENENQVSDVQLICRFDDGDNKYT